MRYRSILRADCFAGEVHVVTGGGSGIGRCVAHELASLGAMVVVTGRNRDKLDRAVVEIAEDGGRAEALAFDIRDEEAVGSAIGQIVEKHGRIHGLVNNAGGQFPAPMAQISKKGFDAVVANNLTGGFLVMREVFTRSMRDHGGAIVNMAADMWRGMPGMAHSGAARAGTVNLTKTAAYEWAPSGVRVNCVAPGWVASLVDVVAITMAMTIAMPAAIATPATTQGTTSSPPSLGSGSTASAGIPRETKVRGWSALPSVASVAPPGPMATA